MGEVQLVIVLLTGSLVSTASSSSEFFFIEKHMTWDDALTYCIENYRDMAQILNEQNATALKNTPNGGYTGSAWIGLFENYSDWNWVDGTQAEYFNWESHNVIKSNELCASMTKVGTWISTVCAEKKPSICYDGEINNTTGFIETNLSWDEAMRSCEETGSVLAIIRDERMNSEVETQLSSDESWIGLSRPALWFWSETNEALWNYGWWDSKALVSPTSSPLPDEEGCAVVSLKTGQWSREPCINNRPFFCYKEKTLEATKILVRITIRSRANMADPVIHDNLKQQLHSAVAKSILAKMRMTWSKLPEKTQEKKSVKDEC